jgi:hypothetical protein
VARLLRMLDPAFLREASCWFGGGTRCVLELGEYRESRDVDFLCADQAGYRALRETITERSLGRIARSEVALVREIRADMYGIRTFALVDGAPLKLEIVREARIALTGTALPSLGVPVLDAESAFAEKLLANADRGLDDAFLARDAVDLAFMMDGWGAAPARAGLARARDAYGTDVLRKLDLVTGRLLEHKPWLDRCVKALQVDRRATLVAGLKKLAAKRWRS